MKTIMEEDLTYEFEDIDLDDFIVWRDDELQLLSGFVVMLFDDEETVRVIATPTPEDVEVENLEARLMDVSVHNILHVLVLNTLAYSLELQ